jgi:CheY-like chemotaxis protein
MGNDMPDQSILSGLRVLVVEDDVLITMLLEDMLDEFGCKVAGPASTIAEALRVIETAAIDIALLDFNLGRGETTYQLADQLAGRGVPFAFVTGLDASSLQASYQDRPTLQKPFRTNDLERVLTDLVRSRP